MNISQKVNIINYLSFLDDKIFYESDKIFYGENKIFYENLFHPSFGLLHALELTSLHPNKIVIESRKENGKKVDLLTEDLLKEVIDS